MKIPHQHYQFDGNRTLIIVAGKQHAVLYDAHDGEINRIDGLYVERPHYSDNEGRSKARSHNGGGIRSATSTEIRTDDASREFIKELSRHLKNVRADVYQAVQILAPAKTKNTIFEVLPKSLQKKTSPIIEGNFHHADPVEIVQKIRGIEVGAPVPRSEEANTILKRFS